jgi:hypothetical protein
MKVVIRSINLKQIVSKKTGVQYWFQGAALDNGQDFPHPFDVMLDDPKKAYAPGDYTFGPDAVYVKDGKLAISARLVPLAAKPALKTA